MVWDRIYLTTMWNRSERLPSAVEAAEWLHRKVIELLPDSDYARRFGR